MHEREDITMTACIDLLKKHDLQCIQSAATKPPPFVGTRVQTLGPCDVFCGQNKMTFNNARNRRFRVTILVGKQIRGAFCQKLSDSDDDFDDNNEPLPIFYDIEPLPIYKNLLFQSTFSCKNY